MIVIVDTRCPYWEVGAGLTAKPCHKFSAPAGACMLGIECHPADELAPVLVPKPHVGFRLVDRPVLVIGSDLDAPIEVECL